MRRRTWAVLVTAALVAGSSVSLPAHASRPHSNQTSVTLPIGADTKIFDMGPGIGKTPPQGWTDPAFDDSQWDSVVTTKKLPKDKRGYIDLYFPKETGYWGPYQEDFYLFRRAFVIPAATGYHAYVTYKGLLGAYVHILFNQHTLSYTVNNANGSDLKGYDISRWVLPGKNVLSIYAGPTLDGSALYFSIHVDARGVSASITATTTATALPTSAAPPLTVTVPAPSAVVSGTTLPVQWQAVPGAASYDFQLWLVKAAPGQKVSTSSVVNFATTLRGTVAVVDVHQMPRGSYQWRMAATDAQGSLLTSWTTPQALTLQ